MAANGGDVTITLDVDANPLTRGIEQAKRQISGYTSQIDVLTRKTVGLSLAERAQVNRRIADLGRQRTELQRLVNATEAYNRALARTAAEQSRGGLSPLGRAGAVGAGAFVVSQNLQSLSSNPGAPSSRGGGLINNLVTGNFVGAAKAAGAPLEATADQVSRLGTDLSLSTREVENFARGLDAIGQSDAASKIRELRAETVAAAAEWNAASQAFFNSLPQVGGQAGLLPTLRPDTFGTPTESRIYTGSLNKFLTQQTALAATTPGKSDDISRARANIAYLQKLTKDKKIEGDARTNLYGELEQQQQHLKSLTYQAPGKPPPLIPPGLELGVENAKLTARTNDDLLALRKVESYLDKRIQATRDVNKKLELTRALNDTRSQISGLGEPTASFGRAVDPASSVGRLGGGPFLTGDLFRYAESFGFKARPKDYLRDARLQVQQAQVFSRNLDTLKARGASGELVGELAAGGVSGSGDLAAGLVAGGKVMLSQYQKAFTKRDTLAERITVQSMSVKATTVILQGGGSIGFDRNRDGEVDAKNSRFTIMNRGGP